MLVMHSINVVRRNRRLQTCGDFHHYYSLEEPYKTQKLRVFGTGYGIGHAPSCQKQLTAARA